MTYAAHHLVVLALAAAAARAMLRAAWPARAPATALLVWQAIALSGVTAAIGLPLAVGLAPYHRGTVTALAALATGEHRLTAAQSVTAAAGVALLLWLLAALALSAHSVMAVRRRHRALLLLVARAQPGLGGGVSVIDHPAIAAYCVPGLQSSIVVSTGALGLLAPSELAAVLAHERAHSRERHDLVLLPFTALCRALPWSRGARTVLEAVALLVEMRADDRAAREHDRRLLAGALRRFRDRDDVLAPAGTLGAGAALDARIRRLGRLPGGAGPLFRTTLLTTALTLLSTPISLFLLPL
ncbi:M56 family metallopeptidase [Nonomuraea sp. NPDC050790]|uniref:M56 family metallopeptidase n=1 Tax=Nonomuraea sp. NPDC050790 TaxID=3364371 RepID=UPI0037BB8011